MISRRELLEEIDKYESASPNMTVCEKLANLYIIYDHLYGEPDRPESREQTISVVSVSGDSEFLKAIDGAKAESIWPILDELMECVKTLQPRVYDSVMRRFKDL